MHEHPGPVDGRLAEIFPAEVARFSRAYQALRPAAHPSPNRSWYCRARTAAANWDTVGRAAAPLVVPSRRPPPRLRRARNECVRRRRPGDTGTLSQLSTGEPAPGWQNSHRDALTVG
jgi:hypothetical protein